MRYKMQEIYQNKESQVWGVAGISVNLFKTTATTLRETRTNSTKTPRKAGMKKDLRRKGTN